MAQGSRLSSSAMDFLKDVFTNPINVGLLAMCGYVIYKIFKSRSQDDPEPPPEPELPPMKKKDFTLEQLREFDGMREDGRILIAVNGKIFDVTKGKKFYGIGAPYGVFAGKDASRGLGTFSLNEEAIKDVYDDLSDLNTMEMNSVREWEEQFKDKYPFVGRLLKPGQEPREYSDTEDESCEKSKTE